MKILFLSARFWPDIGGVETHALKISERLVQQGHVVTVITESKTKKVRFHEYKGVFIRSFYAGQPRMSKKFKIWLELWKMRRNIAKADIVHCHDVFFWYLPFRFLYPFKKVFTTFHGYEGVFPPSKKAILIRRISKALSRKTINVGHYIQKWYGTRANIVLYGGVNKHVLEPTKPIKKLKILLIGRLSNDIGIKTYLELFSKLPHFSLEVCGDGPYRKKLEALGKVHGFTPSLGKYIQKADVICASSYLIILEALSYGKPVISVYENELKKDYLTLAPFRMWITIGNRASELAKILANSQNYLLSTLQTQQLKRFLEQNTWDNITEQYKSLWKA